MGRKRVDLTGVVSGRLTVLADPAGDTCKCQCVCGTVKWVSRRHVSQGEVLSCGCLADEARVRLKTKHGWYGTPTYCSWQAMLRRCSNPKASAYNRYGGRGIKVCVRWLKFENFLADMGPRPPDTTIGRRDNDGDYEPNNCRWETDEEQYSNRTAPQSLPETLVADILRDVNSGIPIARVARAYGIARTTIYRYLKSS